jgi:hypothetical protein
LNSLDPADWFMHCDILQDMGAGRALWRSSRRVAESLREDPNLIILAYARPYIISCVWNLIDGLSSFGHGPFAWFKPSWPEVRSLLAAEESFSPARFDERVARWTGTPFDARFDFLLQRTKRKKVLRSFFYAHASCSFNGHLSF